jgi:ribose-phosphate pyrophosphokinase
MSKPLLLALPSSEDLGRRLALELPASSGQLQIRSFPDGETYLRIGDDVRDRTVILVCTLREPNTTILPLYFLATAARQQGARSVGLVAPYLAYMRQDAEFQPGEAVTSKAFAAFLSSFLDWLVTVDPHLHRYRTLDEIYTLESHTVHAAPLISTWIRAHVKRPLIVGPDEESRQWIEAIAAGADAPWTTLRKLRRGDRDVEISVPDIERWEGHTAVLADDIISTGRTMCETLRRLADSGFRDTVCVGIHAVFAGAAYEDLQRAGAARIVTCDSISHPSNEIELASLLAAEVASVLRSREPA